MLPDGTYVRDPGGEDTSSQEVLYRYFSALRVTPAGGAGPAGAASKSSAPAGAGKGIFSRLRSFFKG